ncbi:AGAP008554-PA-like protein [Anopheles sinensis]|uniref:AGAP008554-PA-like protein n=1 Tax=Anopheles sinensis TaxID=74873 RepID=A0A084VU40_ANOSI|nr:AGAP008554-PA-like protein [Anopheles sinensis]
MMQQTTGIEVRQRVTWFSNVTSNGDDNRRRRDSRIPRLDGVGSRIPVPGSFRVPSLAASRLPAKRGPLQPPATPIGFLRPPSQARSGAISIARSYSGDKLSQRGEPSPFPTLTASTPAPAQLRLGGGLPPKVVGVTPFLKKLDLVGSGVTERLEDIKLCRREFAIPSDDDDDEDAAVPATTESNTTVVIAGNSGSTFVRNEPTVTLQRDGNVTYEFRRSGTFVKSSRESLSSPSDDPLVQRPRPPVMDQTHARSVTAGSGNGPLALGLTRTFRRESTESLDSPVLFDLTRTMSFRRPSTGEMLLEEEEENGQRRVRRPPVLNSTMVNERLLNVTQSIPNITQELLYADGEHAPGDSVLLRTHLGEDQQAAKQKANRLTFNLEESLNLMQFSEGERTGASKHNQTQVLSSTLHSDSMVIPTVVDGGPPLARSHPNSTMLLLDVSCAQDRTLVPSEVREAESEEDEVDGYAAERRRLNAAALGQRETSVEADVSAGKEIFDLSLDEPEPVSHREEEDPGDEEAVVMLRKSETRPTAIPSKQRFSFGLDLTECTLDCSIELCDSSLSLTKPAHLKSPTASLGHVGSLTKQGSFEMDESLGILTPDQMKEFLDSTTTNTNNTNNANATSAGLELQLNTSHGGGGMGGGGHHHKHGALQHHCRIDQTPSPEELPLDPVGVKTDMSDIMLPSELLLMSGAVPQGEVSQADSDPKTDQMSKSATSSKVSNSFITSITSITSLDTGYQGDGEMSRPASRGADHSPSNGPRLKTANGGGGAWQPLMAAAVAAVPRRQDPMTDSDFFTESDADDVFNRGDARRAQIIDGQLYGGANGVGQGGGHGANALFHAINEHEAAGHEDAGQNEDSCMESSGIFTDVENRADDDLVQRRADDQQEAAAAAAEAAIFGEEQRTDDMSPDTSTDTISSSNSQNFARPCPAQSENESANETIRLNPSCGGGGGAIGGGSPPAGEPSSAGCQRDHHYQAGAATTTPIAAGGSGDVVADIGVAGSPPAAAADDGAGSGSGSVVVALATAGSDVARRDADACCSGASSAQTPGSGGSGKKSTCIGTGSSTSRKQLKNEANRGLRKHQQHAATIGDLSSVSRVERLSKTRPPKDSPESPVPRGSGVDHGGSFAFGVGASVVTGGDCDQENKRPSTGVVMGTRSASGGVVCLSGGPRGATPSTGGGSNLSFVKKSSTPNKWDAVMNKIAENKAVMKRNFSDVKSRISCGGAGPTVPKAASVSVSASRRDSPATSSLKSPPSESASVVSRTSTHGKRTISGSVKRGRTHSKDSSLSDLSLSGGSPKLTLKVSSTHELKIARLGTTKFSISVGHGRAYLLVTDRKPLPAGGQGVPLTAIFGCKVGHWQLLPSEGNVEIGLAS